MKRNIGKVDWVFRLLLFFLFIYLGKMHNKWWFVAAVWESYVLLSGWCVIYDMLNINTLKGWFKKNED